MRLTTRFNYGRRSICILDTSTRDLARHRLVVSGWCTLTTWNIVRKSGRWCVHVEQQDGEATRWSGRIDALDTSVFSMSIYITFGKLHPPAITSSLVKRANALALRTRCCYTPSSFPKRRCNCAALLPVTSIAAPFVHAPWLPKACAYATFNPSTRAFYQSKTLSHLSLSISMFFEKIKLFAAI